jgi:ribonuclease BN (tRNA processing enzyme)
VHDSTLESLVHDHVDPRTRLLILGGPGGDTSGLAARLADVIVRIHGVCHVIVADPADAELGPTTAVVLAARDEAQWKVVRIEGLATLDGARFRGPLAVAVARLASAAPDGPLLVLMPGLVRGIAALELPAMVAHACAATAAAIVDAQETRRLEPSLRAMHVPLLWVVGGSGPRVSDRQKREAWGMQWRQYMLEAKPCQLSRTAIDVVGLPPPEDVEEAWDGRVVALLDASGDTLGLGEVMSHDNGELRVLAPCVEPAEVRAICVRDAVVDGEVGAPVTAGAPTGLAAEESRRARNRPAGRAFELPIIGPSGTTLEIPALGHKGEVVCDLVNGVFGDPLLHVRLVAKRRSLLFDIGEATRLPRRIAHQITHVFVSHAHMDHVAGLVWLVRMRMGDNGLCELVGPPGLAQQLSNQLGVFTWNLIERNGPRFAVDEVHGQQVRRFELEAGVAGAREADARTLHDGVVLRDRDVCVRAATVDHNTPVIAYRLELAATWRVRQERLQALGEPAGPWLGELKRAAESGDIEGTMELPGGRTVDKRRLMSDLLYSCPGQVLSYVTDVADGPDNVRALEPLVRGSDIFVCEAGFLQEDQERAEAAAHLTTQACARLAQGAGARVLVPFHFSARYEDCEDRVYEEIRRGFEGDLISTV